MKIQHMYFYILIKILVYVYYFMVCDAMILIISDIISLSLCGVSLSFIV